MCFCFFVKGWIDNFNGPSGIFIAVSITDGGDMDESWGFAYLVLSFIRVFKYLSVVSFP